ncbi:MAG: protein phosphatase CheZ [Sedimenticola sp.]|uniref:Protein phosphatase CheZ n=1 Tax=Sedimenticola thiotaurini TaxID=1543721 RepID=A0A558D3G9_9GAMM|nr:protein phosphatase CheZ [Sedimenticola sp.]MCW8950450.1 protein phosphatase CheZ [Sedimenticola sp.]MDF1529158.1 protein phosphatase CheZ [Sedimenticola sp.]TVT55564.1 MAG: protein phosphatase CheZ [Sedimenticola thiotaurini]
MDSDKRLALAEELVEQLKAGNETESVHIISKLSDGIESELFIEVGRLTRELHEAINEFLIDPRINEMAQVDIPDASERLSYVITMTEKSANTTLGAVEAGLPLADDLGQKAQDISEKWTLFCNRELSVDDFRALSKELSSFLVLTTERSKQLHGYMTDVLMAQDFQDLTGQIIRQVITLVHDVEDKLVQLVRISGSKLPEKQKDANKLEGPVIPGIDQGNTVSGQDDVDDLLSSLGF